MSASLHDRLRARIAEAGPMPFYDFMEAALYDHDGGYFTGQRDGPRAGAHGDFVTSPTLTPVFGATLARFVHETWERLGKPDIVTLVEIGGASGMLMSALLDAWYTMPGDHPKLTTVLFVERDATSHDEARARILGVVEGHELTLTVTTELPAKITGPAIILCNELWDNLPVDVYATDEEGQWHARAVGVSDAGFAWEDVPLGERGKAWRRTVRFDAPILHQVEHPRAVLDWLDSLAERLDGPGVLVSIDYGLNDLETFTEPRSAGTLRSFARHQTDSDVLSDPGTHDVTYDVDFGTVGQHAEAHGWHVAGYTTQGAFLVDLGLGERIACYAARVQDEASWSAFESAKQLMLPGGMGERFKVMVLTRGVRQGLLDGIRGLTNRHPWHKEPRR